MTQMTVQAFTQYVTDAQTFNLQRLEQTFLTFDQQQRIEIVAALALEQLSIGKIDVVDRLMALATGRVQQPAPGLPIAIFSSEKRDARFGG